MRSKRSTTRWIALMGVAAIFAAGALGGQSALAQRATGKARPTATKPEAVGFGHQTPADPSTNDLFGVFAAGTGSSAKGTVSAYLGSPSKWTSGKVICMQISGNDAIITARVKIGGVQQLEVVEVVDNTNPSAPGNPDLVRYSFDPFINPTEDADCWTSTLPAVAIKSGDVRVEG